MLLYFTIKLACGLFIGPVFPGDGGGHSSPFVVCATGLARPATLYMSHFLSYQTDLSRRQHSVPYLMVPLMVHDSQC